MVTKSENLNLNPGFVRRLLRDNRTQGRALARYEYRRAMEELSKPEVFDLKIDFQDITPARQLQIGSVTSDPVSKLLPQLNVPMGSIVWHETPHKLPVVGILTDKTAPSDLRLGLRALLTAYSSDPFARFVFLCKSFAPIPFLGRYQFAYEYVGEEYGTEIFERASIRYGLKEVRSLIDAAPIWKV